MFAAVSFSACSDDDGGDGKALTEMRYVKSIIGDNGSFVQFDYDQQNRIVKYEYTDNDDSFTYFLTYNGNVVKIMENMKPNDYNASVQLNSGNNAISVIYYFEGDKGTVNYTYEKGNLTSAKSDDGFIYAYKWLNGNRYYDANKSVDPDSDKPNVPVLTYTKYNTPKCNVDISTANMFGVTPPYDLFLGNQSANLPESEITTHDGRGKDGFKYSYDFDKDGYITKIAIIDFVHVDGYNDETTYNYTISYY